MSCFLGFLPDIFFYVIIKSSLLILTFFVFFLFLRFSGVFVNMSLTFQKADMQADLDWWSRNHGTGMPQNWPVFEVLNVLFCTVLPILKLDNTKWCFGVYFFGKIFSSEV